jgi:glycosyltransferase involved in cell wall biosynthesis
MDRDFSGSDMHLPLISCIVPVFNGERYLGETLDSILAQTYRPLEIIVADDGSTDGTPAVVASYGERVRYLSQLNAGPAAARNLGLCAARGEFIAFLDADDLWHPEKLARQMARFQARPELDMCVTHALNFWIPELREFAARHRNHPSLRETVGLYSLCTLLVRRSFFDTVGYFNPRFPVAEDTDWFLRVLEYGAVIESLPDAMMYRRLHRGNLTWRAFANYEAMRDLHLQLAMTSLDRRRRKGVMSARPRERSASDTWSEDRAMPDGPGPASPHAASSADQAS